MLSQLTRYVGKKVKDYRIAAKYSQEQLGEKVGFSQSYVGKIERGEVNLSLETLAKLSTALRKEPMDFFIFSRKKTFTDEDDKNEFLERIIRQLYDKDIEEIKVVERILQQVFKLKEL
jgi:transcriptional regulator with XRE-family HTH domain